MNIDSKVNDNKLLINFLRYLADSVENNQLLPNQIQRIGTFFMKYNFEEELSDDRELDNDFSKDDLIKFLSLGYYIYTHILNENK